MDKKKPERADFASKLGLVLATAGSAVGLGNIWRFPVEAGNNGGAAFIIINILCVLLLGIPLMTAEFIVGRAAHTNTSQAYKRLTNGLVWKRIGTLGVLTGWFIMCYYVVVSGWTLQYFAESFVPAGAEQQADGYWADHFAAFVGHPWKPVLCMAVFVLMSHFVIVRGVKKGIERFSKVLMPLLFVILLVLAAGAFFTPGAAEGMAFLFHPDFSKVTFDTVLSAMGQAFFSLSIGMGCLCTYASYFSRETNLVGTALKVGAIDTLVAVLACLIIFPAVFAAGIRPEAGASLVFVALPHVFQDSFAAVPLVGYVVQVSFYFLLVLATLTSVISLHEVPTAWLMEDFKLSRRAAAGTVSAVCIVVGALCSLSMGPLSGVTVAGLGFFDLFDTLSSKVLLPLSGFLITFFVGWFLRRRTIWEQLTNSCSLPPRGFRVIVTLLKYLVPFAIGLIFLSGIGLF